MVQTLGSTSYYRRDAFKKMYLQDPQGCVPEDLMGDDLLYDIKNKFYWPTDAVREQLEKEFGQKPPMWIYVDACYEDSTWTLLTLDNKSVLFSYACKPWSFWFESEAEMTKELRQWYLETRYRYLEVASPLSRGSRSESPSIK